MQATKLKIGLFGYGKMGQAIEAMAPNYNAEVVWKINKKNRKTATKKLLRQADVIIEFTHPDSGFDNIMLGLEAGVPTISGTTGWLDKYDEVAAFCTEKKGGFLYASNFSVGVNLLFALNENLAKLMEKWPLYRPVLSETHHTHKKDAPSGTAISLAKGICSQHPNFEDWHLTNDSECDSNLNIPITSFRKDEVPGTHDITWKSSVDQIRIEHIAHSREGFAEGALFAAHWMNGKTGVFTMKDVLF